MYKRAISVWLNMGATYIWGIIWLNISGHFPAINVKVRGFAMYSITSSETMDAVYRIYILYNLTRSYQHFFMVDKVVSTLFYGW